MGRLYSGNLSSHMQARKRLARMGCKVETRGGYDASRMQEHMTLSVSLIPGGELLGHNSFAHYDIDVLYNTATSWMNGLADVLDEWKPINPH